MAGHSKFKNIQHRKGAQDKKRAKIFSKMAREITVAAKLGGGDPDMNPRLRLAIKTARGGSMPKDRIERAIKVATESGQGEDYEEIRYEGYGPGGVAVIVETLTDNRNRTAAEVRTAFAKNGGSLGETGSVSFMFEKVGSISYPASHLSADDMFEKAVEAGANDVENEEEAHVVITSVEDFANVRDELEKQIGEPDNAALIWKPTTLSRPNEDQARTLMKLIEILEDDDDVQNVYANFDLSDDLLEKLSVE